MIEKKNSIKTNSVCAWLPKNTPRVHGSSHNVFTRERESTSIMDRQSHIESVMSNLIKTEANPGRRMIKNMMKKH